MRTRTRTRAQCEHERVLVTDTVTDPRTVSGLVNEHEIIIEMQLISETNDIVATRTDPDLDRACLCVA